MKPTGIRLYFYRFIIFLIIVSLLELLGYTAMWYNSQPFDSVWNKSDLRVRAMLMGNTDGTKYPRYLSLPYLGYVPYPGYIKYGEVQHNDAGYRGHKIPFLKSGKYRVLCLGGSNTYGLGVHLSSETYPAQLEKMLNIYIGRDSFLSKKYSGAEVLNAGIEAGTSAEELQQYLFKYRYYQPDAVIVHSGVNDAELLDHAANDFQLDYTHYRRLQFHLEPLPVPARWLLKSNFISFVVIRLFYENFSRFGNTGRECYRRQLNQTFCLWTNLNMDSVLQKHQYQYLPFYRNSKTLFEQIIKDSAVLIVLPNVLNTADKYVKSKPEYLRNCQENIKISQMLALETGGVNVAFNSDSIKNPSSWIDDCHLNAEGEINKAQILMPYVISAAQRK